MYNESFYPTPTEVARLMFETLGRKAFSGRAVLEPSAGKGDLADALLTYLCEEYEGRHPYVSRVRDDFRLNIHCIEIDPELQAALRGKSYRLVGYDFLTWVPDEQYDIIIMNPPFANAEEHLLRAWELLPGGEILCLVNSATLENPCTARRTQLASVIKQHGEVRPLGSCFREAFRKTDVAVSLVHLTKEKPTTRFSFTDFEQEAERKGFDTSTLEGQVATRNTIGNMVAEYGKSRELFEQAARCVAELAYYSRHMRGDYSDNVRDAMKEALGTIMDKKKPTTKDFEDASRRFNVSLKGGAWQEVFRLSRFSNLISSSVKHDFERLQKENSAMSFCEENIRSLLESLFLSRHDIMRQCVVDAFDHLTLYYKDNRMVAEGWKTNDSWRVNRRVILPYAIRSCTWGSPSIRYGGYEDKIQDIDRAMAYLCGLKMENVTSVDEALERHARACTESNESWAGVKFHSTFFECYAYKKGSLHLFFKDKNLWETFNIEAARGKNWLPDDVKAREKAERQAARNTQPTPSALVPVLG